MGFTDIVKSFIPAHKVRVGSRASYGLTELGKTKAETFGLEGVTWQILGYLNDNGPSSLNDICEGLHFMPERAREILNRLITSRYVTVVG